MNNQDIQTGLPPKIVLQIQNTFAALGILPLMTDEGVTEIAVNDPHSIFYEQNGRWQRIDSPGHNANQLIEGLGTLPVNRAGQNQNFNSNHPMLSLTTRLFL